MTEGGLAFGPAEGHLHAPMQPQPKLWPTLALFILTACSNSQNVPTVDGQGGALASSGGGGGAATSQGGAPLGGAGGNDAALEGGASPGADWKSYCEAHEHRRATCAGEDDSPILLQACVDSEPCATQSIHPGALTFVEECLANLACDDSDDKCFSEAAFAAPEFMDFREACEAKHDGCEASFPAEYCAQTAAFSSEEIALWSACLKETCGNIAGCMSKVAGRYEDCEPAF